jgi:hypothetical protein
MMGRGIRGGDEGERILSTRRLRVPTSCTSRVLSCLLFSVLFAPSHARGDQDAATALKAAFLYRFVSFVDWPDSAFAQKDATFDIAIVGPDPFGALLEDTFGEKDDQGRSFRFHRFDTGHSPRQAHILFVSKDYRVNLDQLLESFDRAPVLTVSDRDGFAKRGGMIGFFLDNEKLGFEVSRSAVERSPLSISSRMLVLAQIIEDDE